MASGWDYNEVIEGATDEVALSVTLSPLTRVLLRSAIDEMLNRDQWHDMSDAEWDAMDINVSQAVFEIEEDAEVTQTSMKFALLEWRLADNASSLGGAGDDWVVLPFTNAVTQVGSIVTGIGSSPPAIAMLQGEYIAHIITAIGSLGRARLGVYNIGTSTRYYGKGALETSSSNKSETSAYVRFVVTEDNQQIRFEIWSDVGGSDKIGAAVNDELNAEIFAQAMIWSVE